MAGFLGINIKSKVPIKKEAPNGTYKVIIRFIIDAKGKISGIRPETSLGYGMEDEVMRVIKKSPKWIPAIWLNKPVNAYRRQPLTFVVSE
ncbi:MAG: energy transducer TonB [Ferruginibacter sp.]